MADGRDNGKGDNWRRNGNRNRGQQNGQSSSTRNRNLQRQARFSNTGNDGKSETERMRNLSLVGEGESTGRSNGGVNGQVRNGNRDKRNPGFGFQRLKNLLDEKTDNVILYIHQDIEEWRKFLDSDKLTGEMLVLLIQVVGEQMCKDTVLSEQQVKVLSVCCSSDNLVSKLRRISDEIDCGNFTGYGYNRNSSVNCEPLKVMTSIYQFCSFVLRTMPTVAVDYLKGLIGTSYLASQSMAVNSDQLVLDFKALRSKIDEIVKTKKVQAENLQQKKQLKFLFADYATTHHDNELPPNHIRDIEVIPSIQELLDPSEVYLRANKQHGAYDDCDHYLDVQFRLFREDFVRPLREGINNFIENKTEYLKKGRMPIGDLRMYTDVTFVKVAKERDNVVHKLQLAKQTYSRIKWNKSKRLLPGSLVILTTIEKCYHPEDTHFGVVFNRNYAELEKGILSVTWEGASPAFVDEQEYLLFESEVYLESRRYTLEILKELQLERFPMKKFIVDANPQMANPRYLLDAPRTMTMTLKNKRVESVAPLDRFGWPSANDFGLDENQFQAFRAALTKEFTIIQGPPGTGKTFLGLKVAEVLLKNQELWRGQEPNPITVVCYTNHALDQFLEGIVEIYQNNNTPIDILRIGGNSKSATMAEFSLSKVRSRKWKKRPKNYSFEEKKAKDKIISLEEQRAMRVSEIAALKDLEGILQLESLCTWEEVREKYPATLWHHLQNQSWFGIDDGTLKSTDADSLVRQWFRVLTAPAVNVTIPKRQLPKDAVDMEVDDDDDEEEDMEELMERRVLDYGPESKEEDNIQTDGCSRNLVRRLYLPHCSVSSCEQQIRQVNDQSRNNQSFANMMQIQNQSLRILQNRKKFLQKVFQLQKDKLLYLPDVGNLIENVIMGFLDPTRISVEQRWAVYFTVVEEFRVSLARNVAQVETEISKARKEHRAIIDWGDSFILQDCQVVGLTTTGAAKYNNLLKGMKSKIVIVEEAAQVFEAQVVTCITECCQQLIMIGDHLQLRPSPTVYELGTRYHLDLSLFERMVNNKLHCYQLKMQHRMRPEIANLIVGPIYKELHHGTRVYSYPNVNGLAKNLFFISHNFLEASESDSKSHFNKHEETFILGLCRHLTLQGYKPEQMTVLTMYTGQMFNLRSALRKTESCQGVRVTNVDNFQGEENDIILLSLVRSNEKGIIGFLKIDNRVNVALSRARHGLYIIGNMDTMVKRDTIWRAMKTKLEATHSIAEKLELTCQVHGTITKVSRGNEFPPEGGCFGKCLAALPCTHICNRACHVINCEPEKHRCEERCLRKCANQHQCKTRCYISPCPPCPVLVEKTLNCELKHKQIFPCHQNVDKEICNKPVKKVLPCQHEETLACFISIFDYKCSLPVTKDLPCGHKKVMKCSEDPTKQTCKAKVENVLPSCGHTETAECWKWKHPDVISCGMVVLREFPLCDHKAKVKFCDRNKPLKCKKKCDTRLPCGHACDKICHGDQDPKHITYECGKPCRRTCSNGHPCKLNHQCFKKDLCPPCKEVIKVTLPCGHSKELMCYEFTTGVYKCTEPCIKTLPGIRCGHLCPNLCHEACGPCKTLVTARAPCGHGQKIVCGETPKKENCLVRVSPKRVPVCGHQSAKVPCKLDNASAEILAKYCDHPCGHVFTTAAGTGCDHICGGTCSTCFQGRIHLKCQEKCGRPLVCGHRCDVPCSSACQPCKKPCQMKCEHSKCTNKCGEPCSQCKEECTWQCPHGRCTKLCGDPCNRKPCEHPCPKKLAKCGHDCVGFCGEPCPPLCRICDKEDLEETTIWSGEEVEDARFVFLEDCPSGGHTIEVNALEKWLLTSNDEEDDGRSKQISMKCCPLCKTPIRNCRRFGNLIRRNYLNVIAVKTKSLGNMESSRRLRDNWIQKLKDNKKMSEVFITLYPRLCSMLFEEVLGSHRVHEFRKTIDEFSMKSLDFVAKCIMNVSDDLRELWRLKKLTETPWKTVVVTYQKLFDAMLDRQPLSRQEMIDFNGELDRLDYFKQLMIRRSFSSCHKGNARVYPTYQMAKQIITSTKPFTNVRKDNFKHYIKRLDELLNSGLGLDDRERVEILEAMGMLQGHWFKCPNGHIYAITECGGAMEETQCPEPGCGARIGGTNHQVVQGNQLASEMDGATRPAYPSALQYY